MKMKEIRLLNSFGYIPSLKFWDFNICCIPNILCSASHPLFCWSLLDDLPLYYMALLRWSVLGENHSSLLDPMHTLFPLSSFQYQLPTLLELLLSLPLSVWSRPSSGILSLLPSSPVSSVFLGRPPCDAVSQCSLFRSIWSFLASPLTYHPCLTIPRYVFTTLYLPWLLPCNYYVAEK